MLRLANAGAPVVIWPHREAVGIVAAGSSLPIRLVIRVAVGDGMSWTTHPRTPLDGADTACFETDYPRTMLEVPSAVPVTSTFAQQPSNTGRNGVDITQSHTGGRIPLPMH